jgi:hypothetical protein
MLPESFALRRLSPINSGSLWFQPTASTVCMKTKIGLWIRMTAQRYLATPVQWHDRSNWESP